MHTSTCVPVHMYLRIVSDYPRKLKRGTMHGKELYFDCSVKVIQRTIERVTNSLSVAFYFDESK